jgi:hypothetical protein
MAKNYKPFSAFTGPKCTPFHFHYHSEHKSQFYITISASKNANNKNKNKNGNKSSNLDNIIRKVLDLSLKLLNIEFKSLAHIPGNDKWRSISTCS